VRAALVAPVFEHPVGVELPGVAELLHEGRRSRTLSKTAV
jgi:hypothetical protein